MAAMFVLATSVLLLMLPTSTVGVTTSAAMGFHEGSRRTVKCDGGHITGFDAYMGRAMGFAEDTLVALRIKCSSGRINVEYTGVMSDQELFGNLEYANMRPTSADCPPGSGVAAVDWRGAGSTERDHTARIGGLRIHCDTESSAEPLIIDAPGVNSYTSSLKCSQANTPVTGDRVRFTAVEIWYEQLFSGMHLLECEVAQQ